MAGGGVGEAALMGAVLGGGASALQGGDPLKGALMGGALGAGGAALMPEAAAAAGGAEAASAGAGAAGTNTAAANIMSTQPALAAQQQALTNQGLLQSGLDLGGVGASPATMSAYSAPARSGIAALMPATPAGQAALGGAGLLGASMISDRNRYGVPEAEEYNGPLSRFTYNPSTYQPVEVSPPSPLYRAQYAAGGTVEQMSRENAIGMNTGYPQADITGHSYATPWQTPVSENVVQGTADTGVNRMNGQMLAEGGGISGLMNYAGGGGISSLGKYSDGGRMLKGPGDGMSDSIPATISNKRPARLADGEFVVPADVVSHLGNGSTDAGARQLYKMMDKVRTARTGRKAQGRQINPKRYMPA